MTLDQSALLEVLEVPKAAKVDDRIRQTAETIYQALLEPELTAVIGAHGTSALRPGPACGMGVPPADSDHDGRGTRS
jgi:hypothetical protein